MPIDGQLRLSLTVEAPAGTAVTPPAIADKLGPFVVASQTAQAPSGATSDLEAVAPGLRPRGRGRRHADGAAADGQVPGTSRRRDARARDRAGRDHRELAAAGRRRLHRLQGHRPAGRAAAGGAVLAGLAGSPPNARARRPRAAGLAPPAPPDGRAAARRSPPICWRSPSSSASSAACRPTDRGRRSSTSASPRSSATTWPSASGSARRPRPPRSCWRRSSETGGPIAARRAADRPGPGPLRPGQVRPPAPGPATAPDNLHHARTFVEQTAVQKAYGGRAPARTS